MKVFDFPLFPEAASSVAGDVDALYFFALAVSAFFSLLIAVFIFIFFVQYRRRHSAEVGDVIHGSMLLEIVWSVIPLVITMVLFGWGAKVYFTTQTPPSDAVEYFGTGKQWMWKIQHPEGHREINRLHVPVGQPIKLTLTSEDVIHSFYIPAFRVKNDVLPGRYTTVWFEATKTGTYHLFCAEYCGTEHARMVGSVTVMEPDAYQAWLDEEAPETAPVAAGAALFEQYVCHSCHGETASERGPTLDGIFGHPAQLTDGRTVVRDGNYLRESILRPAAKVVAGYGATMPPYQGQISETGVLQLIAYIKSLGDETRTAALPNGALAAARGETGTSPGVDAR